MDRATRNAIERATQRARQILEDDFASQLEGTYDILRTRSKPPHGGANLTGREASSHSAIIAAIERKQAGGMSTERAVADYLRDAAFTALNRFVALKMLEERGLVQQCISKGEESSGYSEFVGMAPGIPLLPNGAGYRLYLESLFDELSTEVKVLFDRRDPASVLWPRRAVLEEILELLNLAELGSVWGADETIGWVYQYFNGVEERKKMREESQVPRNSRELAIRNQFFTPRYVVQFLVDNTLGRTWLEMYGDETKLAESCDYLVRPIDKPVGSRPLMDPRDLRILDPACGSGHFLLYAFDVLLTIYEEAWALKDSGPVGELTGRSLHDDYPDLAQLKLAAPGLVVAHNLYGVDIDARCAQIAALALWLRAQRAFKEMGIPADARPKIKRTNIVIAEPMPESPDLALAFAAELERPFQRTLFDRMIQEMRLAGELGTLLQVERSLTDDISTARKQFTQEQPTLALDLPPKLELGKLDLTGVTDETVFREAEETILETLRRFAESAGGADARRRLFAGDAAQGVALIDLLRTRFDVVLMNPPFGQPTAGTYEYLRGNYHGAHADIYAAFVRRARQLAPHGYIGAITSRSFLMAPRLEDFRGSEMLPHLVVLVDFGLGVMDAASVESAAFVLGPPLGDTFLALDCRRGRDVDPSALSRTSLTASSRTVSRAEMAALPQKKILYGLPHEIVASLRDGIPFEPSIGTAREGMKSFENERSVRLSWEVQPDSIGRGRRWQWFVKGGGHAFYYSPPHLLLNWADSGAELMAVNERINGSTAQVRQASDYWFRPGLTYSKRSRKGFSARSLPADVVFSSNGPAVLSTSGVANIVLLGWINSRPVRALLHLQSNFADFSTGSIKRLPWPEDLSDTDTLKARTEALIKLLAVDASRRETDPYFAVPYLVMPDQLGLDEVMARLEATQRTANDVATAWDAAVIAAYGVDDTRWIDDALSPTAYADEPAPVDDEDDQEEAEPITARGLAADLVSWAVGVAFGRFDIRPGIGDQETLVEPEPFDPLPVCSPGMLTGDDTLPLARPPAGYPVSFPEDGMLVDDIGHPRDLTAAVRAVFDAVFGPRADAAWREVAALLDPRDHDVRNWLASGFFDHHLRRYSRSHRKAPIFWQFGVPSARYSVWCYAHRVTRDSLLAIQNDIVGPKLATEERRLSSLAAQAGQTPSARQRAEIAAQSAFVDELRTLADEVRRVAPLWNPDLDDGIVLVMAPLWRLVATHKAWQKELKAEWDELVAGKFDWAHLAMSLWPERVVPKCTTDRSLAIAHGLDNVFWYKTDYGKWAVRKMPTQPIPDLVTQRTSTAVKAALVSLVESPSPIRSGKRSKNSRQNL